MRETFTQLTGIDFSRSPFHPCQHPPRSAVPVRANYETSSQFISRGTNPAGREVASTQLVAQRARSRNPPVHKATAGQRKLPDSSQGCPQNPQAGRFAQPRLSLSFPTSKPPQATANHALLLTAPYNPPTRRMCDPSDAEDQPRTKHCNCGFAGRSVFSPMNSV